MKTGIVIDSACDLPRSYIDAHQLYILPTSLYCGLRAFIDTRVPEPTLEFYRQYAAEKNLDAETEAFSAEQITQLFLEDLVLKYDRVLVITISQTRSLIFRNTTEASFAVLKHYREKRQEAGLSGSFYLNVLDSKTLFTGEGVLVHEAVRLLEQEETSFARLHTLLEELSQHIYAYLIPADLYYVRNRAAKKEENTIGLVGYHVGNLLDIKPIIQCHRGDTQVIAKERGFERALESLLEQTQAAIDKGLAMPLVVASFAGDPRIIRQKRAFMEFELYAQNRSIEVLISIMSTTAGIHVGPGAFSLAYAAR